MAEAQDLGSCQCGFESHRPHWTPPVTSAPLATPAPRAALQTGPRAIRLRMIVSTYHAVRPKTRPVYHVSRDRARDKCPPCLTRRDGLGHPAPAGRSLRRHVSNRGRPELTLARVLGLLPCMLNTAQESAGSFPVTTGLGLQGMVIE